MRIGVDTRPLQNDNRFRGIGKYTHSILTELAAQLGESHSLVLYLDESLPAPDLPADRFAGARRILVPRQRMQDIRYVRLFALPYTPVPARPEDVDVLLQCDPWGGIPRAVPTVAVFHDLIPLLFEHAPDELAFGRAWLVNRIMRVVSRLRYRWSLTWYRRAAAVVAISESSRRDYLRHVDRSPSYPVRVVLEAPVDHGAPALPTGTDADNSATDDRAVLDALGLADQGYLLYVGGVDLRKNVLQLLRDLADLLPEHPDLKLAVVGREFSDPDALARIGWQSFLDASPALAQAVVIPGYVSDAELATLYRHAAVFVFPSRYEGFGLPVLEATEHGCPVVCYDNSSLPEVAGDAAAVVPDGTPMADAIGGLLNDPARRDELVSRGRARLAEFSWAKAAGEVLQIMVAVG